MQNYSVSTSLQGDYPAGTSEKENLPLEREEKIRMLALP